MSKFSVGDRITIKTNMIKGRFGFHSQYPLVGWSGVLRREYREGPVGMWVIRWDEEVNCGSGDLVYEWMFSDPEPKVIKQYGIVNFMEMINASKK